MHGSCVQSIAFLHTHNDAAHVQRLGSIPWSESHLLLQCVLQLCGLPAGPIAQLLISHVHQMQIAGTNVDAAGRCVEEEQNQYTNCGASDSSMYPAECHRQSAAANDAERRAYLQPGIDQ